MSEEARAWRAAGHDGHARAEWQALAADVAERRSQKAPNALEWSLVWRACRFSHADARHWCELRVPLDVLPVCAALARDHALEPWYVNRWAEAIGALGTEEVVLIGELHRAGWSPAALDMLATAPSPSRVEPADLLRSLVDLPPAAVLDGVRAGLDLCAAVVLAERAQSEGSVDALLEGLIAIRPLTPEVGARINVAITDIGEDIPPGAWQTVASPDARVIKSARESLPTPLWDEFLAGDFPVPLPPVVDDPTGGNADAWNRTEDAWDNVDPPEDRAVQPLMAWSDQHRMDALRSYLSDYLRFLDPRDFVKLSWPPVGYLTSAGAWWDQWSEECDEHRNQRVDGCDQCAGPRTSPDASHEPATWSWSVSVTTYRHDDESESSEHEWWQVAETVVDPRLVHFD
ncbi:hypothetical protein [Cellulomonas biazotea]|uniref:Uncharacterized protein n=1 Tax=Cellulomonas biazotea TaxID=1709 RepID=A0A402DPC2_9CELL|nr:hypothetical protein [Cellulomonas biazotea]GCE76002.1 hypothetical protein CBZ_10580 [Cellulomonas biazotea]